VRLWYCPLSTKARGLPTRQVTGGTTCPQLQVAGSRGQQQWQRGGVQEQGASL
jgi:hypothetical protein